jgi:hypothetical protein
MTYFRDDIARNVGLARRRHANRFVILDVNRRLPPGNDLSISGNHIARAHPITELRHDIVDRDSPGLNETIGLTPRADAVPGKKFVDADGVCHNQAGISCQATAHAPMLQDTQKGRQQGRSETTFFSILPSGPGDRLVHVRGCGKSDAQYKTAGQQILRSEQSR